MAIAKQRMGSFGEAFVKFWTTWTFKGRSSRSEYWYGVLSIALLQLGISFVLVLPSVDNSSPFVFNRIVFNRILILDILAKASLVCVTARRLHDIGKRSLWMLLWFAPYVASQFITLRLIQLDLPISKIPLATFVIVIYSACLILSKIGFVISLVFTTKSSQKTVNVYGPIPNMPEGFGNICPNCETAIPEIAVFCPACGTRVKAEVPKEEPYTSPKSEEEKEDEEDIPESNARQNQVSEQQPQAGHTKPNHMEDEDAGGNNRIVLIGIVVLLVVVCGGIGNLIDKTSSEMAETTMFRKSAEETAHMSEEFRLLLEAAEGGDAEAQNNLGAKYYNGDGVEKDFSVAAYWIRKAADQGDVTAQKNMGILCLNGEGVREDAALAVVWLTKAADQGSPEAMEVLAECYEKGIGVEADSMKGIRLRANAEIERARKNNQWPPNKN